MSKNVITVGELYAKIQTGQPFFIFDVRNAKEFQDWKIEGEHLTYLNIPYFELIEDEEMHYADKLPKDQEIVIVCAEGGASEYIADQLADVGIEAKSLIGGMLAWSQFYAPVSVISEEHLEIVQLNRLGKGCLSYMIISDDEALFVDVSRHIDQYRRLAEEKGVKIRGVVDTHVHADHISGGRFLAEEAGVTYYVSSGDAQEPAFDFEPLEKHEKIRVGRVDVEVRTLPTPGHTPGSISLLVDGKYFLSGDTIFVSGLGRPDLGGHAREWAQDLYNTVFQRLADLSDDILILPAHYSSIQEMNSGGAVVKTLGAVRAENKIMRTTDRTIFTEYVAGQTSATPPNYEEILQINRGIIQVDEEKATELEIGPNRCAVHHAS